LSERVDISLRKRIAGCLWPRHSPLMEKLNWSSRWNAAVRENAGCPNFPTREKMYEYLNRSFFGAGRLPIDFFEFGVHMGGSLRMWCEIHNSPESRFFGFDSFRGLPERWNRAPAGAYSAEGIIPQIDDPRVEFIAGWFQDTLPGFLKVYEPKNRLVIHNDSDLYSSTLYCLTTLNSLISSGTLVVFDEFYDPVHEYRALCDYAAAYRRRFRIVARTARFTQAAVEIT
jgi:Macrocin-O-methyltransferase (TylF)